MANRSIRELERLSVVDYRFYMGSLADHSGNGNDAVWTGTDPVFRREIGGVVGLDWQLAGSQRISTPAITVTDEMTIEIVTYARSTGDAVLGRFLSSPVELRWNGNNIAFNCSAILNAPRTAPVIMHLVATRDASDDGHIYFDSAPQVTGAVGGNDLVAASADIGNSGAGIRGIDGLLYAMRILDDYVSADEVTRLYEHSRHQLWPGASKRAGIISPVV